VPASAVAALSRATGPIFQRQTQPTLDALRPTRSSSSGRGRCSSTCRWRTRSMQSRPAEDPGRRCWRRCRRKTACAATLLPPRRRMRWRDCLLAGADCCYSGRQPAWALVVWRRKGREVLVRKGPVSTGSREGCHPPRVIPFPRDPTYPILRDRNSQPRLSLASA